MIVGLGGALDSNYALAQATDGAAQSPTPADGAALPSIKPPVPVSALEVDYPAGASGRQRVTLQLTVDVHGSVGEVQVLSGEPPFVEAAARAAASWRYRPALRLNAATGKYQVVAARIRVDVLFEPPTKKLPILPDRDAQAQTESSPVSQKPATDTTPHPAVQDIVVTGERSTETVTLSRAEVRQLPGAFGDPFRAVEVMPGVTPIASGLPYFYVRGAPAGNVGYFFDDVAVPALYHAAVGPGVIHPAFIENVQLYSGSTPARYGRYAGAIVAGTSAEPSFERRTEISARLVDAGAFLEAPFAERRGSLMLAGRYSYTGALLSLLSDDVELSYWDYQARAQYDLDSEQSVTLFGFGAFDFLAADNDRGVRQQLYNVSFHRVTARYERWLAPGSRWRLALSPGLDSTSVSNDDGDAGGELQRRSLDISTELDHELSRKLRFRAGAQATLSRLDVEFDAINEPEQDPIERGPNGENLSILPVAGVPDTNEDLLIRARQLQRQSALEVAFSPRDDFLAGVWMELPWQTSDGVTLTPGVRLDYYRTGSATAWAPQPRLHARFQVTQHTALIHGVGIAHQAPSFVAPIPGVIGNIENGLQLGVQTDAGVETALAWDVTATLTLFQTALFNGSDPLGLFQLQRSGAQSVDATVDRSLAHSYGLELFLRRPLSKRLGGFLSYTLSNSTRSIENLEGPSGFDRRHVLNAALAYDLGRRWRLGGRFVFYTGSPGEVAYPEAATNPPRTPAFFRLDWRLEKSWLIGDSGAWWALVFEVLNTTLQRETLEKSCYAYGCRQESFGPVTIPSVGIEASF